ncbi:hypothetical protein V6Z11_D13G070800 [Gossypium hirsutum]
MQLLNATAEVSLLASMKFTQISRKNLSENGFPSSSLDAINTVNKSDPCRSDTDSSFFLVSITFLANSSTSFINFFSFFSDPKSRYFMVFQTHVGVTNRSAVTSVVSSSALANGMLGNSGIKHPGSTPKGYNANVIER